MLPDATGEDEGVEPAERGDERAQLPPDAIDEEIDCLLCVSGLSSDMRTLLASDAHAIEQLIYERSGLLGGR